MVLRLSICTIHVLQDSMTGTGYSLAEQDDLLTARRSPVRLSIKDKETDRP